MENIYNKAAVPGAAGRGETAGDGAGERAGSVSTLVIDMFCGLGGWSHGFLAEGYRCIGFDIERHDYGTGGYPGELVLQDVLTLHGSQFRNAAVIVASPPCQAYSYRAMPWKRAKALPPPSNELFDACFRIQREACEAATTVYGCARCGIYHPATRLDGCDFTPRHIPLVVENVRGAQPWVGRAKGHYGSFYLWGDVPALMPSARVLKINGYSDPRRNGGKGAHLTSQRENDHRKIAAVAQKQPVFNDDKLRATKCGGDWFGSGDDCSLMRHMSSKSTARKAASAQIAKIPFELARWVAHVYKPEQKEVAA